jgi:hypothetical protein
MTRRPRRKAPLLHQVQGHDLEKGDAAAIPVPSRRESVATQIRVHAPQSLLSATNIGKPEATQRRVVSRMWLEFEGGVIS